MRCPKCGKEEISTPRTYRLVNGVDEREHFCDPRKGGCGCYFVSEAYLRYVYVYNPDTMKGEKIEIDEYKDKYLDHDLCRAPHPTARQQTMF